MSLPMFGKLMATNAADIFGLQQKGRIAPGKDADFVFIQPNSSYVLTNDDLEYRHKVSPYVGRTTKPSISRRQDSRSLARLAMSAASWMRMAIDGPATHRAYCLARRSP